MTINDAQIIFKRGHLMFNETKVFLDGNGQYFVGDPDNFVSGDYEFVQRLEKVYLRTTPPILSGIKDLEIGISLGNLPVQFYDQS